MADVIILGCGPAGVSAALYTVRAGLKTLILAKSGGGSLYKTDKIENYYGFTEPVSGAELMANGKAQARRLGAELLEEEAVGISWDGEFAVQTKTGEHRAPFLILATGSSRKAPDIQGIREFEGRGVSYCAVCDAFFYRKKEVAVLGAGEYALHEARELIPVVGGVTILTDGAEPAADFPPEVRVDRRKLSTLKGDSTLEKVVFEDGGELTVNGVFVAVGVAGSSDFAKKLGAEVKGTSIVTDENRSTNLPGLYAAGDCAGGLLQIAKAVYDGAVAGTAVIKQFRAAKK
jgi:thioredoxin reductase (NADPH)